LAGAETTAIDEQYLINKQNLVGKYASEDQAKIDKLNKETVKANDEKNKALIASDKAQRDALNNGLQMIESLFAGNEKAEKAFALAKIGIDTAKAISSLTANSEANPANAVTFGGAGIIQFATGLVRIVANIASAKKLLSGSGTSTPDAPSTTASTPTSVINSGFSSPSGDESPTFDFEQSTSAFTSQPLQAFVIQQDVQDQTEISTQIQQRATL